MPRFAETRFIAAVIGLAAGLAVALGALPASAQLVVLNPGDSGIVRFGEPLVIFGVVQPSEVSAPGGSFTHTYNFGFDIDPPGSGDGAVSATPNFLAPNIGFDMFAGNVMGPGLPAGGIDLIRDEAAQVPRINRIAVEFAATHTADDTNPTPYKLTISGSLLPGGTVGNYTGDINVTPLPGAVLVLLSALGGLVAVRRYRSQGAAAA